MRMFGGLVRLVGSAVVAALVIAACAPRPESESEIGAAPSPNDGATGVSGGLWLTLSHGPEGAAAGETIEFTIALANPNAEEAIVDFPDGQRFDFEVLRGDVSEWRWASDLFFAQMLGRERVAPGGSIEWSGRREGGLPAGSYLVRGTLTTSERPVAELAFTVGAP